MMTLTMEVRQYGQCVATVDGSDADAVLREAHHYAMQYVQYGPIEVIVRFNGPEHTPNDPYQALEKIGGPGRT